MENDRNIKAPTVHIPSGCRVWSLWSQARAIRIISGGLMRDESRDINTAISTLCCSHISRPHTNATDYCWIMETDRSGCTLFMFKISELVWIGYNKATLASKVHQKFTDLLWTTHCKVVSTSPGAAAVMRCNDAFIRQTFLIQTTLNLDF